MSELPVVIMLCAVVVVLCSISQLLRAMINLQVAILDQLRRIRGASDRGWP